MTNLPVKFKVGFIISTHTLARRVTGQVDIIPEMGSISTHTLARRVTLYSSLVLQVQLFQPTPSHGG